MNNIRKSFAPVFDKHNTEGFDNWVETFDDIKSFFDESRWKVFWSLWT